MAVNNKQQTQTAAQQAAAPNNPPVPPKKGGSGGNPPQNPPKDPTKDKMTKAIDAEAQKQGAQARGTYKEAPGGGTPAKGGGRGAMKGDFEVVDNKEEAEEIRKEDPNAVIRYNQPRDENGQFTYNSANNKEITTKYSRGHTLPPFLKGVNLTFIKKGSEFQYTDADGKIKRVISSIDMTEEELISACKKYLKTEGGFAAIVGTAITKHGRPSATAKQTPSGKIGDLDVSTLAQSTQNNLNRVSQNKNGQWIADQTAVSDIIRQGDLNVTNPAYSYKLAQQGPGAKPPVKRQTATTANTGSTNTTVGVGAGSGASTTQTPNTNTQQPQQPQQPVGAGAGSSNNVNMGSLQQSAQNMMKQYLASKGNAQNVNKSLSQQGKQNLLNKWAKK